MSLAHLKVPALVSVGLVCCVVGVGAGALGHAAFGEFWKKPPETGEGGDPAAAPAMGGMQMPRMMGAGMPGMGGRGPNSKIQLASLVAKIDQLTQKPLTINLTDEKRAKLREQLQGLDTKEELSEEEAKKRLDAILEVVKEDRATLEAAGYRWPGQGGGGGGMRLPPMDPNPFTNEQNGKHLKSLQDQVKAKGA
jgi:hypothetical protein